MNEGLIGGEGFAVDASVVKADVQFAGRRKSCRLSADARASAAESSDTWAVSTTFPLRTLGSKCESTQCKTSDYNQYDLGDRSGLRPLVRK